jgi:hypothetical protein
MSKAGDLLGRLVDDMNALGAMPSGVIHAIDTPRAEALKGKKWCGGPKLCEECLCKQRDEETK